MKTVCFFGIFDQNYARNRVLMNGFRGNGFSIVECRVDPRSAGFFGRAIRLYRAASDLKRKVRLDLIIVAFPGQTVAWIARLVFGRKIILDAFLSLYDSNVFDRGLYPRLDPKAWRDWLYDWSSIRMARLSLLDTYEHIKYFSRTFGLPESRFIRVLIGADDKTFYPRSAPKPSGRFIVHFHGTFIPLQGTEYIVEAAKILKQESDIIFNLVGGGQTLKSMKESASRYGLSNVDFVGTVPVERVPEYIAQANVCLGIFGWTGKAARVIPNKVYECAAMGKAVITGDSPAIREIFKDGEDVILCNLSDGASLSHKILLLKERKDLRDRVEKGAARTFERHCSPKVIVSRLLKDLETHEKD